LRKSDHPFLKGIFIDLHSLLNHEFSYFLMLICVKTVNASTGWTASSVSLKTRTV
jgi:hypothetical protein